MPVNFDEYRETRENDGLPVDPGTNAHAILSYLARNPDLGFRPSEIREHVDVAVGSVNPALARLEERGLVEHESPYWSAGDDDRLAALDGTTASTRAFEERHADDRHHDRDEFDGFDGTDVDPRAESEALREVFDEAGSPDRDE